MQAVKVGHSRKIDNRFRLEVSDLGLVGWAREDTEHARALHIGLRAWTVRNRSL